MEDLFAEEQQILEEGFLYLEAVRSGVAFDLHRYAVLLDEYSRLLRQLRRATRVADRTTINLHEDNQDLTNKVHYDALTGLYNRHYLEDNLRRAINATARAGGCLSVLMVDVDFFKKFNDTYGHLAGDECLKSVAEVIAGSLLRPDDFVARYGGEEFAVILPDTDEVGIRHVADRILNNVRERNIPHEKNEAADCVTVSIGATTSRPMHEQPAGDYIKCADKALYRSKRNGRNQYTYIDFSEAENNGY
jgi:diguanylate cyclase (GGDEF)-like protein